MRRGIGILTLIVILTFPGMASAVDEDVLQEQIDTKQKEVEKINEEIAQTQGQINQLQGQAQTLQGAIGQIDTGIKQATLGIRSSETNIEKLTLEIESLGYKVQEVGDEVNRKQLQVGELLRTVQRKDKYGFLQSILGSDTLAEGLSEVNALKSLQDDISKEAVKLSDLQNQLRGNIDVSGDKKSQLEVEVVNLVNRKVILDEQKDQKAELLVETKNQEGTYQSLLSVLEQEQQALLDEISNIESQLSKNFDRSSVPIRQSGYLIWPVTASGQKAGVVTQNYGETAYSSRFYKGRPHNGMDIGAPTGTEVRAGADGTVSRVDYNGLYYQYGRYILIDHGNGLSTLYAHLSGATVKAGDTVDKGSLIGYVGSTGFATGPHLHFGLYATPSTGWRTSTSREQGGLFSVPPATGMVPIGVTLNPAQYL